MARIYANENFYYAVVEILQHLGHDVLTSKMAGNANKGIPDEEVLSFAIAEKRIVLTFNYQHFKRLHRFVSQDFGIIICTEDRDYSALANEFMRPLKQPEEALKINSSALSAQTQAKNVDRICATTVHSTTPLPRSILDVSLAMPSAPPRTTPFAKHLDTIPIRLFQGQCASSRGAPICWALGKSRLC
jgi:predicted nuclease of predicted toxin-antitoxin system